VEPEETRSREIPEPLASTLRYFRDRVGAEFGSRLLDLRLYGSWARGEQHEESDIDVLVVVRDLQPGEEARVWELGLDALYAGHDYVSALACSPDLWRHLRDRELLIAHEIERDGIPF